MCDDFQEVAIIDGGVSSSRVEISKPSAPSPIGAISAGASPSSLQRSTQTVLIVDDDLAIRELTAMMLGRIELITLLASNGLEGIHVLQRHPEVNVVILDVAMPVMNGEDAFREIRRFWPNLPVILISGFDQPDIDRRFGSRPPEAFLQKPFGFGILFEALRKTLREPFFVPQ